MLFVFGFGSGESGKKMKKVHRECVFEQNSVSM